MEGKEKKNRVIENNIKEIETASKLIRAKAETLKRDANFLAHKGFCIKAQATWEIAQTMYGNSEKLRVLCLMSEEQGLKELPNKALEYLTAIHKAINNSELSPNTTCSLCGIYTKGICYLVLVSIERSKPRN